MINFRVDNNGSEAAFYMAENSKNGRLKAGNESFRHC